MTDVGDLDLEAPCLAAPHGEVEIGAGLADGQQCELDLSALGEGGAGHHERPDEAQQGNGGKPRPPRRPDRTPGSGCGFGEERRSRRGQAATEPT